MVGANHFMAQKLLGTRRGVADDGGAQVADVHLFRHVRCGVVDNDGLGLNRRNAQLRCVQHLIGLAGDPIAVQEMLIKPGPAISTLPATSPRSSSCTTFFPPADGAACPAFGD
ncbi:hypothetical protein AK51_17590 [Serratia nematodiphila DZ0503SBS1]|nr:hypothetical protein AK51_17590 [Serratia nematodiphila DZ0503SBS1]